MANKEIPKIISKEQALILGLSKYFTGVPCSKGHISERYVKGRIKNPYWAGPCIECVHKHSKEKYWKNPKENLRKKTENENKNPRRKILKIAKSRAKQRNLEFSLTEEDIKIPELCPICGVKIKIYGHGNMKTMDDSPSLDRKDNSLGYIPENVNIICFRCNSIKRNATSKELRAIADWMDKQ